MSGSGSSGISFLLFLERKLMDTIFVYRERRTNMDSFKFPQWRTTGDILTLKFIQKTRVQKNALCFPQKEI